MMSYMKISLLFIISFFINDVFGDEIEIERVSVNEGGSVTLHTHVTELQTDDLIMWMFKDDLIARINRPFNSDPVYEPDVRFTDRLKMNTQTGDLTITHITSELIGLYKLYIISGRSKIHLFSVSVFGDENVRVSVNDGGSVTLHTHLTELQTDHLIEWWFKGTRIARINREVNSDPVYEPDERFTDRLKMNPQTGDLTITHITSEITGLYELEIIRENTETQSFSVSLSPKVRIVKERDSVSLHIDVTEEQRNEKIHWKIKHNNSPVAEIITENRKISTPFIEERFRDRLKLDDQTGDLIITHMKNEDSGQYEADVTIGSNTHTIHKTFSFTGSEASEGFNNGDGEDVLSSTGLSSGVIAGICVSLLLLTAAAAGVVIYRHRKMRHQDPNREETRETSVPLNIVSSNGDVPPV